jgi:hypothetical protein
MHFQPDARLVAVCKLDACGFEGGLDAEKSFSETKGDRRLG